MTKTLKQLLKDQELSIQEYIEYVGSANSQKVIEIEDALEAIKEWLIQKRQEQCARRPFIMTLKVDMIDELLKELGQ